MQVPAQSLYWPLPRLSLFGFVGKLLVSGGTGGALIKSSRYVLGALFPVVVDRLRLLLESLVLSPAVEGRTSGESGGLGLVEA